LRLNYGQVIYYTVNVWRFRSVRFDLIRTRSKFRKTGVETSRWRVLVARIKTTRAIKLIPLPITTSARRVYSCDTYKHIYSMRSCVCVCVCLLCMFESVREGLVGIGLGAGKLSTKWIHQRKDTLIYVYCIYRPTASDLSEENNEYLPQSRGKKVITPPPPNKKAPRRGVGNAMGSRGWFMYESYVRTARNPMII